MHVIRILLVLLIFLYVQNLPAKGELKLPRLVSSGMVLQRELPLTIWGQADPTEKIKVRFKGKTYTATSDEEGNWKITLAPQQAGGPYTMEIIGTNQRITLEDILIGEVWLCSGQSNMVHYLDLHKDRYADEIARANNPEIRQFLVPTTAALSGPSNDLPSGEWKAATPENVLRFSVVGYFFSKALHDTYGVPIGFINASVGGTPIESWTSEEGLRDIGEFTETILMNKDSAYVNRVNRRASAYRNLSNPLPEDRGLLAEPGWYDPSYRAADWQRINVPGYWEDQGIRALNGIVWYRREIEIPAEMAQASARIYLGRIIDADQVYINGMSVGNTSYQYPQRRYDLAQGILTPGINVIAIKVTNNSGKGGFVPDKPYYIVSGTDTVDLKGDWKYKVSAVFPASQANPSGISPQHQPTALFNGMIAPLTNYRIRGVVWYQGESNTSRPEQYQTLMPALIDDWRGQWKDATLPFLYVQLPGFMEVNYSPEESNWAELREAQRKTLEKERTAMVVTLDLGEWNDIHPGKKKPIGDRLALAARYLAYGEELVYSGPVLKSSEVSGGKVSLTFDHTGSGLITTNGQPPSWFAIAGEDKEFVWAEAVIQDDKVILYNESIGNPVYVRYAWADNPASANLMNREGLPASPFEATVGNYDKLWYGKKAAVVLTYDDALEVHLDNAIPSLDSLGFKGTFYLSAASPGSARRLEDWKKAAGNGHELGNHTLFHPCDAKNRSWVTPENDLSKYSTAQIVREIEMTNTFLKALDGKTERTFAYTCGDMETADGSFVEAIREKFVAMRGVQPDVNTLNSLDLSNLNCYVVDNSNADQLITWAEKAKAENALLIILFHGVGGGHPSTIDLDKHNEFLGYLKAHENDFWVTTLIESVNHSLQHSGKKEN